MDRDELLTAWVVVQQKSLDDDPLVPRWIKYFLRWVYQRYGWAAVDHDGKSYCKLEFIGIFDSAPAARYAAMMRGGSYRELPLNCSLPEETCQFGVHDFPLSSASPEYRKRALPFVAMQRTDIERLEQKVNETLSCAEGKCEVKVV